MTVVEAMKSAQYGVDQNGHRTGVLLTMQSWQSLMDWIADIADARLAAEALTALHAVGGRSEEAGWLAWDDIREDWGEADRQDVSLSAFEKDWDNPADAIYDNGRDLFGVPAQPAR